MSALESYWLSKKDRLKKKNDNKAMSFKVFEKFFDEYTIKDSITSENEDLKEYLEDTFELLEDNIIKTETIKNLTQQSAVYLVEGSLLAIRNKITDKSFEELIVDYDENAISKDAMSKIKTVYNRIVNLIA